MTFDPAVILPYAPAVVNSSQMLPHELPAITSLPAKHFGIKISYLPVTGHPVKHN